MSKYNPDEIRKSDNPRYAVHLRAMRRPEGSDRTTTTAAMRARHDHAVHVSAALAAIEEKIVDRTCNELFERLGVKA